MRRKRKKRLHGARMVSNACVVCPVQGRDVDIERCYTCGRLSDLVTVEGETWLSCTGRHLGDSDAAFLRMIGV